MKLEKKSYPRTFTQHINCRVMQQQLRESRTMQYQVPNQQVEC